MKEKENNEVLPKANINWYPGHMAKTKREIIQDLRVIDVVIELLDARIPISSQNPDFNNICKDKKKLIILNKSDLANNNENKKWINYFKNQGMNALEVDSNSGKGVDKVPKEIEKMMQPELEKIKQKGIEKKTIRVMVLGIPNVGKSSFINRISKKASMEVANRPGVTRKKQWIRIGNQIELLDTPGMLWPKFDEDVGLNLAYTGSIKDETLEKTEIAYSLVKKLCDKYKNEFSKRYNISEDEYKNAMESSNYALEFMYLVGKKRGALISGGNIDLERTAGIILDDFRSGKAGKITLEMV